jgi:hypothetical protein
VAAIRADLWNPHLQPDDRFSPADLMPDAEERKEREHREFVEKVMRGEKFEVDREAVSRFRKKFTDTFSDVRGPEVTEIGPSGKRETVQRA